MSSYNGRRGPNVSQYVHDLNTIPSAYDQALQQEQENFDFEGELAKFTNTEFIDFDPMGDFRGSVPVPYDPTQEEIARENAASNRNLSLKYEDILNGDYSIPTFNDYTSPVLPMQTAVYPTNSSTTGGIASPAESSPKSASTSTTSPTQPNLKRKHDSTPTQQQNLEDASRLAAEEDKRRRNTAASARFRVKKKQREQALERTVKEITDKNDTLETKVGQLEMENRWLKNLLTEKNDGVDVAEMYQKFRRESEERDSRKPIETRDGVGTAQ